MNTEPFVDMCFQIMGSKVAVDHGFALHTALSRVLPHFHDDDNIGLKLLRGKYTSDGFLDISPYTEMVLRLPVSRISKYIPLAGKQLNVMGENVMVGTLKSKGLVPAVALYAHVVTTRNGQNIERFSHEIARQMKTLEVQGKFQVGKRRTFQVHGKQVVGYAMLVSELNAQESIILQENGLGGRRKMGCGFFEPFSG